ncbi:hypothetical protein, partial [Ferrigenium sp. UT5]|uniref:hypothetical protein n=1 Tax=Ferrigenium sp. UT5 TaxID=3242105 RepID=UPI0038B30E36
EILPFPATGADRILPDATRLAEDFMLNSTHTLSRRPTKSKIPKVATTMPRQLEQSSAKKNIRMVIGYSKRNVVSQFSWFHPEPPHDKINKRN